MLEKNTTDLFMWRVSTYLVSLKRRDIQSMGCVVRDSGKIITQWLLEVLDSRSSLDDRLEHFRSDQMEYTFNHYKPPMKCAGDFTMNEVKESSKGYDMILEGSFQLYPLSHRPDLDLAKFEMFAHDIANTLTSRLFEPHILPEVFKEVLEDTGTRFFIHYIGVKCQYTSRIHNPTAILTFQMPFHSYRARITNQ